jgi:predicted ester cyclase
MTEDAGMPGAVEENKALVQHFMEAFWDRGDLSAADGLFAAGEAAAVQGWAARVRASMPDLRVTVDHLVAEGDRVAAFYTWRGTHTGAATGPFVDLFDPSGRIGPTGNAVHITGSFLFRVAGGKLTQLRRNGDTFGLFQQFGVLPRATG